MALQLRDNGQTRRLQRDLERHANRRTLTQETREALRSAAEPLQQQLRMAYRSSPSSRRQGPRGRPPLRQALADATVTETRSASAVVTLRVDGRRMPSGMRTLPAYRERVRSPWRHPVYGNRELWVSQRALPLFYPTVTAQLGRVERAIDEVADRVVNRVT